MRHFCWSGQIGSRTWSQKIDETNSIRIPEIYPKWEVVKKEHCLLPETPVRLRNTTRSFSGLSLLSAISISNSLLNSPCAMLRAFDWPRKM